ncbi:hypothetical protein [Telmatospirillum sp. J64-1]|uniref:hypothetical protein n=1 Tax=Telmatospirillum sp. J64-1 TaxID=2502183 RepID=UPI00115D3DB5|nr:hypothetical protein [Telmatospirillum sp. J64-1]
MKRAILGLAVLSPFVLASVPSFAQPMGTESYSFPARNPSFAAQVELTRRNGGGGAGGVGTLNQYVTNYNSNSTSIGNMTEITQILEGGSSAWLDYNNSQNSHGNQGSSANTSTTVNNSQTVNTSSSSQSGPGDSAAN